MRVKIPTHLVISFAVAILCGLTALYATVSLYQSYIEKTAYSAYLEMVESGPGSVGHDAAENTPHAAREGLQPSRPTAGKSEGMPRNSSGLFPLPRLTPSFPPNSSRKANWWRTPRMPN